MNTTEEFMQELLNLEEEVTEIPGALSVLSFFEKGLSKSELKSMAQKAVESVEEIGNPLQVAEALSAMELFIKEVKDDKKFKDYVRVEAAKTPKGFVSNSGAKIELFEAGTTYDFTNCGDPVLSGLEAELLSITEKIKARKELLKNLPLSGMDLVTTDGELLKIYPPAKTSVSSYKITLAK